MNFTTLDICLCGSGFSYRDCCQPFHNREQFPQTAEALMRSRFTAYARHDEAYLLSTWDNGTKPEAFDFSKPPIEWCRLEILNTRKGLKSDSKGWVEFKAYYWHHNEEYFMHERSRFKKTAERWYYLDGLVHPQ